MDHGRWKCPVCKGDGIGSAQLEVCAYCDGEGTLSTKNYARLINGWNSYETVVDMQTDSEGNTFTVFEEKPLEPPLFPALEAA